ncbi:double-stranded RNA-binding protein 1-like [Vicia villosa]|uniref:double-stranded RNA-binding protein 1-like n=1 Tax=Vicia villosa TaxID=3911 RepID=UPI00273AA22B|nr:double-stranded RNA-binding protein 1-like [Vicia villosa]
MYKTQLQHLCHQRKWSLPKYSVMYDGPQHKPIYKAYVLVNGVTFTSSDTFSSSKEAQNQAAKSAFLNLSSPSSRSSIPTDEYGPKEEVEAVKSQETPVIRTETARLSKQQLQNYARKNNLEQPVYTIKNEGLLHDIRFKASVVIGGKSFDSQTFFNTRKEAEQAAAKVALMELPISADLFKKDDSCPAKSLLLELTQREGFPKPIYITTESRSSNMPTFFSTVEVDGVEFHGKASRSKKQAEHDAAKIAYIALQECGLNMYASFSSSTKENSAIQSTDKPNILKSKRILNFEDELLDQEIFHNSMHNGSFPLPPNKKIKISNMGSSSSHNYKLPPVKVSESNNLKTPDTSSYFLGNRFKVYTKFPNIIFPEGITIVPIGDDKWIAASLECPNDKDV